MKSKKIGVVALLALAVAAPSAAEAAVRLKVSQGFGGSASQEFDEGIVDASDGDYTPTSFSAAYVGPEGGFVDFTYSTSGDETQFDNSPDADYERTDWALVGGYSKNNVAGYVGWRSGEGETTFTTIPAAYTLSSQGVVAGFSVNFKPAPKHTITPSLGVGFLAGEMESLAGWTVDFDWTFGLSYGLAYSYQATKNIAVGLEFKGQNYTFEWIEDGTSNYGNDLTVDESLQSTGAFVSFVF